jgi:protein-disulfide isomerase/uncharacterized membrane protein
MANFDKGGESAARFSSTILLIGLGLLGLAGSAYSLYLKAALDANPSYKALCDVSSGVSCSAVNASRYASLFGVPLGSYGVVFYAMVVFLGVISPRLRKRSFADSSLVVALWGLLFSAYLFIVSKFLVGALCPTCVAIYLVNVALFAAAWAAGRESSFGSRLSNGVRLLLAAPVHLVKGRGTEGTLALVGFVVAAASSVLALTAPFWLKERLVDRSPSSAFVREWERSPRREISPPVLEGPDKDYVRGKPLRPVTFVEFSDFECPACKVAYAEIEKVLPRFEDKVLFVYKNYPLDASCNPSITREMHRHACHQAQFARCAGEQGKYWEAVHYLFSLQEKVRDLSVDEGRRVVAEGAKPLGLEEGALQECLASNRHTAKIAADVAEGERYGVQGTPSMWIDGKPVPSFTAAAIEAILERAVKLKESNG